MFRLFSFSLISAILFTVTACTISYSERNMHQEYEVVQVFPPIYYGTDDFPESAFYVTLKSVSTGEYFEKLFVDERCENNYKKVNTGDKYFLSIKETKNIFESKTYETNLREVLCNKGTGN